ncbi:MAG: hypothetical protein WCK29_01645 [archaeon]
MPSLEIHCAECKEKLGEDFSLVHRYLDMYAPKFGNDAHRQILHHREGVELLRALFEKRFGNGYGDKAARAAELHIMADFNIDHVPTKSEVIHVLQAYQTV